MERLIRSELHFYIKVGASFSSYQFMRTCVVDSHLAAFHTTLIMFPNVKELFNSDELLNKVMNLLTTKKYGEAKYLCAQQLTHVKYNHSRKEIDFFGNTHDHMLLFRKLECPIHDGILR